MYISRDLMKNFFALCFLLVIQINLFAQSSWKPVSGGLMTRWASDVRPDNAHQEYPRPQLVRDSWENLNGLWDYAIVPLLDHKPASWNGQILVPFPVESALSGVKKTVDPDQKLWYRRYFTIPAAWKDQRILLHFEAVDWEASVRVNGNEIGSHRGGYDSFTYDITDALKKQGQQELVVAVWDPSDKGFQPTGKQSSNPHSIWYTSSTGIWQTVWLEPVPETAIQSLIMTPEISTNALNIKVNCSTAPTGYRVKAVAYDGGKVVGQVDGEANGMLKLHLKNMKLWSPDDPFLYDLEVSLIKGDQVIDNVKSYFGMRDIRLGKSEKDGFVRLFLNNNPLFQYGPA